MVRNEQVLLCYPDLAKISGANIRTYQYNGPINIMRLKNNTTNYCSNWKTQDSV